MKKVDIYLHEEFVDQMYFKVRDKTPVSSESVFITTFLLYAVHTSSSLISVS